MTGVYTRIKRNGEWKNIEFELLTDKEMEEFESADPEVGWKWAIFFAKYLRDEVKPLIDGLIEDGIIEEGLKNIGIVLLILFLYNDLDKRVKNLYTVDYHDTNRPKVDILADDNESSHERIWEKIGKNKKEIEENALEIITKVDRK